MTTPLALRPVERVITAHRQLEGGGFLVRRPLPSLNVEQIDPFLLVDEMGPVRYAPGQAVGAPDHPHRGFETVTYILEGEAEHEDSAGHRGVLGPGDVQWMTAGAGVVHSEMPSARLREEGGRMHGFQVWVNLPARDKLMPPRYQEVPAARIPEGETADGLVKVRVIAGEALGRKAVIDTRTPILYQDFTLKPKGSVVVPAPPGWNVFVYVFAGAMQAGGRKLTDGQLGWFGDGEAVELKVPEGAAGPARALLLGGRPIREPLARYGPFVMNTREELEQAFRDYQSGKMGRIRRA